MSRRRAAGAAARAVAAGALAGLVLASCSAHHRQSFEGGNNGLRPTSTTTAPLATTTTTSPPPTSTSTTTLPSSALPPPASPEADAAIGVAERYIVAALSFSYDQPGGLGAWVARTEPYDTPAYYAKLTAQLQAASGPNGDSGDAAYWQQIQQEQETRFVEPTGGEVELEAPHTATSEVVRVFFTTTTTTLADPNPSPEPAQPWDVDMELVNGKWLVSGAALAAAG